MCSSITTINKEKKKREKSTYTFQEFLPIFNWLPIFLDMGSTWQEMHCGGNHGNFNSIISIITIIIIVKTLENEDVM